MKKVASGTNKKSFVHGNRIHWYLEDSLYSNFNQYIDAVNYRFKFLKDS